MVNNKIVEEIAKNLNTNIKNIRNINELKKGMTNHSLFFTFEGDKYIMRIPGEGSNKLINRKHEGANYRAISKLNICDEVLYFDDKTGYKLSRYVDNSRNCNPNSKIDITKCMQLLRQFHEKKIQVPHYFDVFERILYYESLWEGNPSIFKDYVNTKKDIFRLQCIINGIEKDYCLCHIDSVFNNFLFYTDNYRKENILLIDWEYAAMQDPHIDIAMFAIYALYDVEKIDHLIDIYFDPNTCSVLTRIKIYCYIAACGLLWSNWCEYKRLLGVEFGDYALRQYEYAKEFYKKVSKMGAI